ncbi:MAG TPA: aminopeptidase [Verrucomicrobiae bacterium]|nr:aminopeptidase [Verrucomicrobiae bacterium]
MDNLANGTKIAVRDCLGVKPGEQVLVITDEGTRAIGQSIWEQAKELGAEAILVEMIPRKVHGEEPPAAIAEAMKQADVVLAPTSKSLSHTQARREANKAGTRIATLPSITEDIAIRTLNADYGKIAKISTKLGEMLTAGKTARLTTLKGTDLTMGLAGREGHPDTGIYTEPGSFGNLPAGEAYIAPMEGTSQGTVVIDGAIAGIGLLDEPVTLTVENGYAVRISGGNSARQLEQMLAPFGKEGRNIAELGIGTNDQATLVGIILEDEKVAGTVHVAVGNNVSFGGNVNVGIHLDGIITQPTLEIDGKLVMENGTLLI